MKLNSLLVDSFITYVKNEMLLLNTNLVLRKEYKDEEIDKISKDALINDLISIYGKIDNYSRLYLDNNHLRIKKMPDKELNEITQEKDCVGKKRRKKKKNKKKNKQNKIIDNNITKNKNQILDNNEEIINSDPSNKEYGNKEGKNNHLKDNNECEEKEETPIKIWKDYKYGQISKDRKKPLFQ